MRTIKFISCFMLLIVLMAGSPEAIYSEQVQRDMYASVVVMPVFKLSLDNANINFGFAEPGKTIELNPQTHYNEVKCRSNKGTTWYLKISVIGNIIGPEDANVGLDSFKWMVVSSTGDGVVKGDWHSFTQEPVEVYTSGPQDMVGGEVILRFKYKLDMPPDARGGNYNVNVLYSMTDTPS